MWLTPKYLCRGQETSRLIATFNDVCDVIEKAELLNNFQKHERKQWLPKQHIILMLIPVGLGDVNQIGIN